MEMATVLFQILILLSILIFGINIGLATGLAKLSKKLLSLICIVYGGSILLMGYVCVIHSEIISSVIQGSNTEFYLLLAGIMLIAGILTIREWRVHDGNTKLSIYLSLIAPYPCYILSLIALILYINPTKDMESIKLILFIVVALIIVIVLTYIISKYTRLVKKAYQTIMGNFMITLGSYYLLLALIMPNISIIRSGDLAAIKIGSIEEIIEFIILLIVLLIIGFILNRKSEGILK